MIKRSLFILLATVSTLVGIYPIVYFLVDRKFGLLASKSEALLASAVWNAAFYIHIVLGGVALLVGWTQFNAKRRTRNITRHRLVGKIYVFSVLISALTGVYIAFFATGGLVPSLGFISMGIVWFATTLKAYISIRNRQVINHQKMMIYSYATCLAAVTLRIYLPVFIALFDNFNKAYSVVSWLSWVPNLVVAYFIIQQIYPDRTLGPDKALSKRAEEIA